MSFRVMCVLAAAAVTAGVCVDSAQAVVITPNLAPGSQYRIVFASSGSYQAYNSTTPSQTRSLSYWQNIVAAEAAASSSPVITGATFNVVGSIYDGSTTHSGPVVAGMNIAASDGIPVYNTQGQLVAADSLSFWSLTHQTGINTDRNGNTVTGSAWIGWYPNLATFRPFGATNVYFGSVTASNPWVATTLGGTNFLRVYAISAPVTVAIPEPGSVALLGVGGLALVRRRR